MTDRTIRRFQILVINVNPSFQAPQEYRGFEAGAGGTSPDAPESS